MTAVWILSVLALAAAAVRIARSSLVGRYRFFFAYVCLNVLSALVLWASGTPQTRAYLIGWEIFEPFLQVLLMLSVAEVYGAVAGQYPRIGKFGVGLLVIASAIAAVACLGTAAPELSSPVVWRRVVRTLMLTHRWLNTIAFGTLCVVLGFFHFFRRPIAPNVRRHSIVMVVYCGGHAAAFGLMNVWPAQMAYWGSVAELALSAVCGVAWALTFSTRGEAVPVALQPASSEEVAEVRAASQALLDDLRPVRPFNIT